MKAKNKMKEKIMQELMDDWCKSNPEFEKDVIELASDIVMFNVKYGTNLKADNLLKEYDN